MFIILVSSLFSHKSKKHIKSLWIFSDMFSQIKLKKKKIKQHSFQMTIGPGLTDKNYF